MGLLDGVLNSEQGRFGLGLLAASSARSDGAGFGQRLGEAVGSVDQWKQQQAQQKQAEFMQKLRQLQMDDAVKESAQKETDRTALMGAFAPTTGPQAMAGGDGPTLGNAADIGKTQTFDLRTFMARNPGASFGAAKQAMEMNTALNPKPAAPIKMGANDRLVDPVSYKELVSAAPEKAAQLDPNKPFWMIDGKVVPNKDYQDYAGRNASLGGTRITNSINTGQKGFDNTLKLRGDFRSEPVYKAYNEVQSAYSQINAALKQASPAGDMAGATKLMKILDPGSVVRESELGMAMSASGLMDRLTNYAQMTISGQKLTPTQRVDFQRLADSFYAESSKLYNAKRGEYKGIAERNELNTLDILGPEAVQAKAPVGKPTTSAGFDKLPPPVKYKGQVMIEEGTGRRLRSNGMSWVEEKK